MLVPFRNCGIDARCLNRRGDGRFLGILAIDVDGPTELRELALGGSEEVSNLELNRRTGWIKSENLIRTSWGVTNHQTQTYREKQTRRFHVQSCFNRPRVGK